MLCGSLVTLVNDAKELDEVLMQSSMHMMPGETCSTSTDTDECE